MEQPAPPWPPAYREGLSLFDHGLYWECHEALEDLWLEADAEGAEGFYQGLIQAAAAFDHVARTGRLRAAVYLLDEALTRLAPYDAPRYMDLDLPALRASLERARAAIAAHLDTAAPPPDPTALAPHLLDLLC